jgi:GTPase SAR1 family protein
MNNNNKSKTFFGNNKCCTKEVYIALVGGVGVGKSALMVKYITKRFIGEYSTEYGSKFQFNLMKNF